MKVILTEDLDSARMVYTNGVTASPKNALNFVGLGHADLHANNATSAKTNFNVEQIFQQCVREVYSSDNYPDNNFETKGRKISKNYKGGNKEAILDIIANSIGALLSVFAFKLYVRFKNKSIA